MPALLYVTVSPRGAHSISRQLGNAAVEAWKARNPNGRVIERDLTTTPLTFVDIDWIAGAYTPAEHHNQNHKKALAISDQLVGEVIDADEIVLATPMYNFAVPAALKAWVDHVVRAGKTFRYGAAGAPEGLLAGKNKKVLAIVTSGGNYKQGGLSAMDHEVPYLRLIFRFMGITDVQFIQAGGTGAVAQGRISPADFLAPYLNEIPQAVEHTGSPHLQ